MEHILTEIKLTVLRFLDTRSIINMLRCNKSLYNLLSNELVMYNGSLIENGEDCCLEADDYVLFVPLIAVYVYETTNTLTFCNTSPIREFNRAYRQGLYTRFRMYNSVPAGWPVALITLIEVAGREAYFQLGDASSEDF